MEELREEEVMVDREFRRQVDEVIKKNRKILEKLAKK